MEPAVSPRAWVSALGLAAVLYALVSLVLAVGL